jgi:hypothetical protein
LPISKNALLCAAGLAIASAASLPAQAAPIPAIGYASAAAEQFSGGFTSVGYQFTTSAPLLVSALGIYDHAGNDITASGSQAGLYTTDASHTLLAATTITSGDATSPAGAGSDVFRYHNLTVPLVLPAGTYMLASQDPSGWFTKTASGVTTGAGLGAITIDHATFTGLGMGGQPLAYPDTAFDTNLPGNFGPNFLASPVPEPTSIGAILLCGTILVSRKTRSTPKL